jgi:hypothetical protein
MKSNANYVEGLRRMYGSARVNKALGIPSAPNSAKKGVQNKLKAMNSDEKVVKALNTDAGVRVKKSGNFKNGKSFSEFMSTKTKKFGTPN